MKLVYDKMYSEQYDYTDDDEMDDEPSDDGFSTDEETNEESKKDARIESRDKWSPQNIDYEKGHDGIIYVTGSRTRIDLFKADLEDAFKSPDVVVCKKDYSNAPEHYDLELISKKVKEFEAMYEAHVELNLPAVIKVYTT